MFKSVFRSGRPWNGIVLFLATAVFATASQIVVAPTVTPIAGGYEYAYTITNNTPDDPFLIDIPVPEDPSAVTNLMAPAGFTSAFDPGLGLVSFLEDTSFFTSTPQSGFSFDSPDAPGLATFQATVLSSSTFDLYTISGSTTAPVPEPAFLWLLILPLLACLLIRRPGRSRSIKVSR